MTSLIAFCAATVVHAANLVERPGNCTMSTKIGRSHVHCSTYHAGETERGLRLGFSGRDNEAIYQHKDGSD
jgi:hypothetical protein